MKLELSEVQRENIKEIRKAKNVTADAISEKLGKSKNWFAQIERGRQKIDLDDLKSVAKELHSSVIELIGYMPGEFLVAKEFASNNKNETDKVILDATKLLEENIELKKENEVLRERLQQISSICNLV